MGLGGIMIKMVAGRVGRRSEKMLRGVFFTLYFSIMMQTVKSSRNGFVCLENKTILEYINKLGSNFMNDTIIYKINNAYMLPYQIAIDEKAMEYYEKSNDIIDSSRIYFICKIKKKGIIFRKYPKPEVLYIGETFNKKSRFSSHKKILQATTLLKSKDNLFVYFLQIRFSFMGISQFHNDPLKIFNEVKNTNSKTSVQLLERLFIKLFNPILNEKHNNSKVKDDLFIKDKLIKKNIEYVCLDIGMNDPSFNFVGGKRHKNDDQYTFDLINDKITNRHPSLE